MEYEYWLAAIRGISDRKKLLLRKHMKSAREVYYIEETDLKQFLFLNEKDRNTMTQAKKSWNLSYEYEELKKGGIRLLCHFDPEYPEKLKEIPDSPYALYVKGALPDAKSRTAAIVGARRCTPYGEKYACEYAGILAEYGVQIVSGLARGIDGIAQRGALLVKGKTFAVMGSGVDVCYPRENQGLYEDILEMGGGILSELPPHTPPLAHHFPRRNRIISGLSDFVLVMEAREKSGSLITADMALEQGKDVFALPGPVDSPLSAGCNRLIYQGAAPILSAQMLLEETKVADGPFREKGEESKKMLETVENMVYSSVWLYPKSTSQIMEELNLTAREAVRALSSLEIQGYIKEISKNYYIKVER